MVVQIDFFNSPQNFSTRVCAHRNDTQSSTYSSLGFTVNFWSLVHCSGSNCSDKQLKKLADVSSPRWSSSSQWSSASSSWWTQPLLLLWNTKKYLHIIIITDITGWTRCGGVSRDPLGAFNLFISSWDRRRRCR